MVRNRLSVVCNRKDQAEYKEFERKRFRVLVWVLSTSAAMLSNTVVSNQLTTKSWLTFYDF